MRFGAKPMYFMLQHIVGVSVFLLCVILLLSVLMFNTVQNARAEVAVFYPTSCLGGWKNTDKVIGAPEITKENMSAYGDANSASVYDATAQIFCGGFKGEIPYDALQKKVELHFSWAIADEENGTHGEVIDAEATLEEETPSVDGEPEVIDVLEEIEEDVPVPDVSLLDRLLFSTAHAQESEQEEVTTDTEIILQDVVEHELPAVEEDNEPTSIDETVSFPVDIEIEEDVITPEIPVVPNESPQEEVVTTKSSSDDETLDAYFEVFYTLDGVEWSSLGYVARIDNDVHFELPIAFFSTLADLEKVQIALHTIPSYDETPKIFLDALWLEVEYETQVVDTSIPPGFKEGDVIFSEIIYENQKAVTVLRGVSLATLSGVLSTDASTTTGNIATSTDVISATSTASSSLGESIDTRQSTTSGIVNLVDGENLTNTIAQQGIVIELWLYDMQNGGWTLVADNSLLSRTPNVLFTDDNLFWLGQNNSSIWRFNPGSGGYETMSFNENEKPVFPFYGRTSEPLQLTFNRDGMFVVEPVPVVQVKP